MSVQKKSAPRKSAGARKGSTRSLGKMMSLVEPFLPKPDMPDPSTHFEWNLATEGSCSFAELKEMGRPDDSSPLMA